MIEYSDTQKQQISDWDREQSGPVELAIHFTGHPADKRFEHLAGQLETLCRQVQVIRKNDPPPLAGDPRPAIRLGERIWYSALPYEHELSPFLQALTWKRSPAAAPPDLARLLARIDAMAPFQLFIAQACPHCPAVVRTVIQLAMWCPDLSLEIIDGSLFDETARAVGVTAAPCLILDDDFRWTGAVSAREIAQVAADRDPARLSTASLKTVLEDGRAQWIADQMIETDRIFDGFPGLLCHETWSVRLGAMVVVEELAERRPDLGIRLCPLLLAAFEGSPATVKGDILYALGEVGDLPIRDRIRELAKTLEDDQVRQAAEEAVQSIESRY